MRFIILLSLISSFSVTAQNMPPKAVIYGGAGACADDCVTGAVEAARIAGLHPLIVYPDTFDPKVLDDAAVWIQPGGQSRVAANAMGTAMLGHIRTFVRRGGGYVGFCAGGFPSTAKIGTTSVRGLGILPGRTILYRAQRSTTLEKMSWVTNDGETSRQIYWEGGPHFVFDENESKKVSIIGKYSRTNQISTVQSSFGKGRVSVTGAHPEAPQWWRDSVNLVDRDGLDYDLTTAMIVWAAKISD